jgi:hypothetical protein
MNLLKKIFSKFTNSALPPGAPPPILPGSPPPAMPASSRGMPQMSPPTVSLSSIRFQETADYEKGFTEYFNEKIRPVIRDLEQTRLLKLQEIEKIKPKAQAVFIGGFIFGLVLTFLQHNAGYLLFSVLITWGIKAAMLAAPISAFAGEYKQKIIPLIVKFFGDFSYSQKVEPPYDALTASGLFDYFSSVSGDDYIEGNYKGTHFKFWEVLLYRPTNRKNGGTTTVFNGMILLIDVKKSFAGETIVKRDSQKGLWAMLTGKSRGLKNVKINDTEFEKIFEVYSSDENEALTLVNPDFIRRMMQLNAAYPTSMVRCSFLGGKMILAISYNVGEASGKLFEMGSFDKALTDTADIHKYLAQMNSILKVIETINPAQA